MVISLLLKAEKSLTIFAQNLVERQLRKAYAYLYLGSNCPLNGGVFLQMRRPPTELLVLLHPGLWHDARLWQVTRLLARKLHNRKEESETKIDNELL